MRLPRDAPPQFCGMNDGQLILRVMTHPGGHLLVGAEAWPEPVTRGDATGRKAALGERRLVLIVTCKALRSVVAGEY